VQVKPIQAKQVQAKPIQAKQVQTKPIEEIIDRQTISDKHNIIQ